MVQPDKRLLWHPRQENRFVVGGGSHITLYEWAPDHPEIRVVTSQQDLQYMKCFAWSPDPILDDLVAVGVNTGRVDLLRLEAAKHTRGDKLSNGPAISLTVRNSRACNVVTFCNADPNYLATGLDKVRGDCSLLIWDITSAIPVLALEPGASQDLSSSITSLSRRQPTLPKVESTSHSRSDTRILQQYAPQEIVSCLSFIPKSTNLLLAGISYRWLRLFDLRNPVPNVQNVPGKVQAIATDPFDQHRIATIGDNIVSIWDARKLVSPLIFSERDATADRARLCPGSLFNTVEFSSTRRGCLATLERDASYVRFWDIIDGPGALQESSNLGVDGSKSAKEYGRTSKRSWAANLPWPSSAQQGEARQRTLSTENSNSTSSIILANTKRTKSFSKPLASFALVPEPDSFHPLSSKVIVVNKDGDLEMYALYDAPKHSAWSARGDLTFGSGVSLKTISGTLNDDISSEVPGTLGGQQKVGMGNERGVSRSRSTKTRDNSSIRGRSGIPPGPPALFGRGDAEGFPALTSSFVAPTGLAATRPQKGRTYSPSALRKYHRSEDADTRNRSLSSVRPRSLSKDPRAPVSGEHGILGESFEESGRMKRRQKLRDGRNKEFVSTVEDDISMVMRRRALLGYCISRPHHNMWITHAEHDPSDPRSQALSDLWALVHHAQQLFATPVSRVHGYDFANQGILGIWEGIPPLHSQIDETPTERPFFNFGSGGSGGSGSGLGGLVRGGGKNMKRNYSPTDDSQGFQNALSLIESRKTGEKSTWKPAVNTSKLVQRQVAMKLCGWSLKEDEMSDAILRWEKEGQFTRAAAWLIFTRQYTKALDVLLKSNDMSHKMISGTIAALIPHGTNTTSIPLRNHDLREHCERLLKDMKDPYLCAIITYLAVGDWADVLKEETIPLRERLAIALQFLEDKPLSGYLRRIIENSILKGNIDGIIVTGLTKFGMDILQAYVNNTGDVQTAALLGCYVCPHKVQDSRAVRWLDIYRDMLDGFKLYHQRVTFDIERGTILTEAVQNGEIPDEVELVPKQVMIRCNYCNKPVAPEVELGLTEQAKWKPTTCSNCARALPRCSVCLLTLSIVPDAAREIDLAYEPSFKDTIDDAIVICQTCRHGGHASHLMEWFFGDGERTKGVCPVADCECRCADEC